VLSEEEEYMEELFDQLWVIPKSEMARVPHQVTHGGYLVWVHKERLREGNLRPEEWYPVSKHHRFERVARSLSAGDFCEKGKHTYAEVVTSRGMADRGRWILQSDKPLSAQAHGHPQALRGRQQRPQGPQQQRQGSLRQGDQEREINQV
jgi:hypothetical protein